MSNHLHTVFVSHLVVMKYMKFETLEMIQKALHTDELPGRRFMASKPNEVAHEHNHGILCSNALKIGK